MASTRRVVKRVKRTSGGSVLVGRFGSDPVRVRITGRATVEAILIKAGIMTGGEEKVWVNGAAATSKSTVKSGDILTILSPKEAGNK